MGGDPTRTGTPAPGRKGLREAREVCEGAGQPESRDPDRYRLLRIWRHLLDRLFILLTLICNWVDQQSFFLEGVIRIINKAKWRLWTTYSCALCAAMSPGWWWGGPRHPPRRTHFASPAPVETWRLSEPSHFTVWKESSWKP